MTLSVTIAVVDGKITNMTELIGVISSSTDFSELTSILFDLTRHIAKNDIDATEAENLMNLIRKNIDRVKASEEKMTNSPSQPELNSEKVITLQKMNTSVNSKAGAISAGLLISGIAATLVMLALLLVAR